MGDHHVGLKGAIEFLISAEFGCSRKKQNQPSKPVIVRMIIEKKKEVRKAKQATFAQKRHWKQRKKAQEIIRVR